MSAADLKLRQKPVGIAAGAEDAKYQAKYKELKRKVKDIEAENDKLHFRVLQAKLTIRRMKMERAILYERLTTVPSSPNLQDRHPLPPMAALQAGGPGGPPLPLRLPPGGGQSQHRDYPFHSGTNVDTEHQRLGGGPVAHILPDNGRHYQHHHQHPRGGDPRINLTPGIDPRSVSIDNQPAAPSPRLPIHSPPGRISSTHEAGTGHPIPPTSTPYESRSSSINNIPHDSHHVHTSPVSSQHVGGPPSRKRSHSHSSPRTTHPHQIETHQSGGHIHAAQPYRVLSTGSNHNNSGHGPGSGTVTPGGTIAQPPHQYPENLAPVQQPLHSPPLSEMDFERGGRAHHSLPHLQQLPHQHVHPHSQHPHYRHVAQHHHHPHPAQAQAHTQNEYGGGLPIGDTPTSSASPAIQAHGAGYESASGRGITNAGQPGTTSASASTITGSASVPGRTHAHRMAYDYPPTQPDRERERERDRDPDREWERERDRAREYSRGELINYSPPHHRTRSSQNQSQSRPLSRTHSQSHFASGGRSQSQSAVAHPNPNTSGEYEHSTSNPLRSRNAPASGLPPLSGTNTPQAQYHSSSEDPSQGYRDYAPPPDSNTAYTARLPPSSRATTPSLPSNGGSESSISLATNKSTSRDRDRETAQLDRGTGPPTILSPAAATVGRAGDNDASDQNHQVQGTSDSERNKNEMKMDVDGEYQAYNEVEEKGRRNGAGSEVPLQPQDDPRSAKRHHRQADSSPEREHR